MVYPVALAKVGIEGNVVVSVSVMPNGRVDTMTLEVVSTTNQAFLRDLRSQLAAWEFHPAHIGGRTVSGSVSVKIAFHIEQCMSGGTHARQTVFPDSSPPVVAVVGCTEPLFHNVVKPKYIKTTRTTLSGVWSPGFEDGFFTPCRDVKLPTPPGLGNNRLVSVEWDRVDTTRVPIARMRAALPSPPAKDKRYFVRWEGELTGPQPSGHMGMAAFRFRPTRLIDLQWWEGHACPLVADPAKQLPN